MAKSELRLAQELFARKLAEFEVWLKEQGICYSMGDAFRDPRVFGEIGTNKPGVYGHPKSCHKLKLAQDLNFEIESDHIKAHDYWDDQGGAGRLHHDMNHYSWGWKGMI
jgi:hypothetical protein